MDGLEIETHPWAPFIPANARILIMGTFPPQPKRWTMNFYYPNRTNDFWFMMGYLFYGDRYALYDTAAKEFRLEKIKALLNEKGIAMNDTCHRISRLMGNASDKFLKVVEPVDLVGLLKQMPQCRAVATTGEKAAAIIGELTDTEPPRMGESTVAILSRLAPELAVEKPEVVLKRELEIWRMPSTSRAYPLKLEKKAEYYARMFRHLGILN